MAKTKLSKFRLAANGVCCVLIIAAMMPVGLSALFQWLSGDLYFGKDPDGGDKVLAISLYLALPFGVIASISLIRTILAWRAHSRDQ